MTLQDRADSFARAFPKRRSAWPRVVQDAGRDVLYAIWKPGQDYRNKTRYYGAYPAGYLPSVDALFPDVGGSSGPATLHAFSGSVPALGESIRLDVNDSLDPDVTGSVYDAAALFARRPPFLLVLADPPYSAADAARYETPMVDRRRAIAALASVVEAGGHLVWLDTVWPMHNKRQWVTVGQIAIIRSTNHRVRLCSIFERAAS